MLFLLVPCTSALVNCTPPSADLLTTYGAPRYFPFPPFRVVLETKPGSCDLGAPAFEGGHPTTLEVRRKHCASFERGGEMMPEPFVVQVIASFLAHCPWASRSCYALDLGGNLGLHTAYMAALGAEVDVVEPAIDLAATIRSTVRANCWTGRVRVHNNGITALPAEDGTTIMFKGGWRLDDRAAKRRRRHQMKLVSVQRFLRGKTVDLLKIDIDNSAIEIELIVAL